MVQKFKTMDEALGFLGKRDEHGQLYNWIGMETLSLGLRVGRSADEVADTIAGVVLGRVGDSYDDIHRRYNAEVSHRKQVRLNSEADLMEGVVQ